MTLNWGNLTKEERARYMYLQTAPSYGGSSYNLPENCSECTACGQAMVGRGLCDFCYKEWKQLNDKLQAIT